MVPRDASIDRSEAHNAAAGKDKVLALLEKAEEEYNTLGLGLETEQAQDESQRNWDALSTELKAAFSRR